jgi:hypothetical protein
VVVRRQCLAASGLFDPALLGGQDFELWLRLARVTKFARVRQVSAVKRGHQTNITISPKYVVYQWWKWRTVERRHTDVSAADRQRIVERASEAAFAAGRRLLLEGDVASARDCLSSSVALLPRRARPWLWLAAAQVAGPWFSGALRRRERARSLDVRRDDVGVPGDGALVREERRGG